MDKTDLHWNNPTNNPFRDSKNRWITTGLFYELRHNKEYAKFTIYDEDREIHGIELISLGKRYLEMNHIPGYEYEFAQTYLGGWQHWLQMQTEGKELRDLIQSWRDELEIKLKAAGAKAIIDVAITENGATRFNANKWLADKGWLPQKGRPKKEDIERAARIEAGVQKEIEEDLARIRIVK